jgi:hypothetical protein
LPANASGKSTAALITMTKTPMIDICQANSDMCGSPARTGRPIAMRT